MKPNIYQIATKELSQDAFITWLLLFADESCNSVDNELNLCAVNFVEQLIKRDYPDLNEEIVKVKAGRQWENIDIWAEINDKYLIIIEDKTNSGERSDQLERYKKTAFEWCIENDYEKPICVYIKTGNESQRDLRQIVSKGYSIFNRQDFINLFNNHPNINNDIFNDFKENILRIEYMNHEYISKKIGEWKSYDYVGFYQLLEKKMSILNWHYVDNPNGGFWNALLSWTSLDIYPTYLQIEENKLCFKISTHPEHVTIPTGNLRGNIRNNIHNIIIEKAVKNGLSEIKKPQRFGDGNYMTVAIVEREFWLGKDHEEVNMENVIENLKKYLAFMKNDVGVR